MVHCSDASGTACIFSNFRSSVDPAWAAKVGTGQGKLYLASVMDMASRRILGFALGEHHDAQLAYGALVMAVAVRRSQVPGVIMHSRAASTPHSRCLPE